MFSGVAGLFRRIIPPLWLWAPSAKICSQSENPPDTGLFRLQCAFNSIGYNIRMTILTLCLQVPWSLRTHSFLDHLENKQTGIKDRKGNEIYQCTHHRFIHGLVSLPTATIISKWSPSDPPRQFTILCQWTMVVLFRPRNILSVVAENQASSVVRKGEHEVPVMMYESHVHSLSVQLPVISRA